MPKGKKYKLDNVGTSSAFISLVYYLLPKDLTLQDLFIARAAGAVPCGDLKRLPIHHQSAYYIFWSLGII